MTEVEFGKPEYILVKPHNPEDLSYIELPEYASLPGEWVTASDGSKVFMPTHYSFMDGYSGLAVVARQRTGRTLESRGQKINIGYTFDVVRLDRDNPKIINSYGIRLALKERRLIPFDPKKLSKEQ